MTLSAYNQLSFSRDAHTYIFPWPTTYYGIIFVQGRLHYETKLFDLILQIVLFSLNKDLATKKHFCKVHVTVYTKNPVPILQLLQLSWEVL